ncbi:erythromycin esterase family protein [Winogradskyella thalassocola]|uniref:Erythromycin esterase homolog n=1 Tax=Winogradskyella thalassocola TaxID=262004 RepID=A0A1G8J1X0_9FLAO|nr:erythromycin esterase family protein [Winogradskyella thalassocola]SDI25053.1 Erythromycin esterase homolog [Winogradskyella thalassocola]
MKIIKLHVLRVVILTLPLIIFGQNKYNLDFETLLSNKATNWTNFGNGNHKISFDLEHSKNGKVSGRIESDDSTEGYKALAYNIPANFSGKKIKLTGYLKTENVTEGFAGLWMRIDPNIDFDNMASHKIQGTNDWTKYEIELDYEDHANNIAIGGLLEGKGKIWIDNLVIAIDGKNIQTSKEIEKLSLEDYSPNELTLALSKSAFQLDLSNKETMGNSLDSLIAKIGTKEIVAIGESTHGTSEFFQLREMITKRLVAEKGFNIVVLENPYDDIEILNNDLNSRPLDSLIRKHLFSIYQTQEMKSFLQWYKDNRTNYKIQLKGCDDSYWTFYELLKEKINPVGDKKLKILLKNLESNISKSSTDNLKKEFKINNSIYNNILAIEDHLKSINNLTDPIEEILFNGKNTYVNYVNIKNKKPIQSRDEIMADRISFIAKNSDNKIIIWAHNAHISNKIIADNEIGIMGRNLKKEFGKDYYTIGLTTLKGNYSYMNEKFINDDHNYTEKLKNASFQSTEKLLWENAFAQNSSSFYIHTSELKNELKTDKIFGATKLLGYSIESEEDIYYIPILKNFDSLIFIEDTHSTTPIFK